MAYSLQQQRLLEAMGLRLYQPIVAKALEVEVLTTQKSVTADNAFWQGKLGQNIRRIAGHIDLADIATADKLCKKLLWQKIRPQLKQQ